MSFFRHTLPLLLLLICFTPSLAQISKGTWLVGGDASFNIPIGDEGAFSWETTLNPRVGYFLGRNFAVGATVPFGYWAMTTRKNATIFTSLNGEFVSLRKRSSLQYGLAPFIRGYFGSSPQWRPFVHVEAGRSRNIFRTVVEDRPTRTNISTSYNAVVGAGLAWFVRDHVALEALLAYRYNTPVSLNTRIYGSSVGITFGLQFYLFKR
jgi:hypothetical protein